jgi:UDP-2,3-diacylglucosamine hydrolase
MSQRQPANTGVGKLREPVIIEGPLGIIAGGGQIPCAVAESVVARGLAVHVFGIRGEASEAIERFPNTWVKWGELGKLFATCDKIGCRDLVIVGGVSRPDLANVKFDFGAIKNLPFIISLSKGGDDHVLSNIVRFFESKEFRVHGAAEMAPELLMGEGNLGKRTPTPEELADIEIGLNVVRELGRLDVGQAAVVAKGYVLAVEAAEGTDAMLERCAELRKSGRARGRTGVLIKAPKPGQEERIDMPTIGPATVQRAVAAGLAGIAVAAGRVLMAEREATIDVANRNGLFLLGQNWDV